MAVPVEGITLEGYVDLVYRDPADPDALVVVDYKTDAIEAEATLESRMAHYAVQGAAYTIAVATATGARVDRCVFVFLAPGGVLEVEIAGADARRRGRRGPRADSGRPRRSAAAGSRRARRRLSGRPRPGRRGVV